MELESTFEDELVKNVLKSQEYWRVEQLKDLGINPFHKACEQGDTEAVKELLKLKLDINATDHEGRTPLHLALQQGHIELGSHLIEEGAKLFLLDHHKKTPLTYLAESGQVEKAFELFKVFCQQYNVPPITEILLASSEPFFSLFLAEKRDLDQKDNNGDSILHRALIFPSPMREKMIKNLVEHRADLTIKDGKKNTPLQLALLMKPPFNVDTLGLLIDKKSLNDQNSDGRTPLHIALQLRPIPEKIIQFLIDNGAKINAINNDGESCRWLINALELKVSPPLAPTKQDTEAGLRKLLANVWTIVKDTQMRQKTYSLEGGREEVGQREVVDLLKKLKMEVPRFVELEQACDLVEKGLSRSKKAQIEL